MHARGKRLNFERGRPLRAGSTRPLADVAGAGSIRPTAVNSLQFLGLKRFSRDPQGAERTTGGPDDAGDP